MNQYFHLLDSRGAPALTVPSTGDSSGDTSDIGDTGDASWKNSFSTYVYTVVVA